MSRWIICLSLFLPFSAQSDIVQWSKGYTANCDNPVERIDGTLLAASEIARVEYHLSSTAGLEGRESSELTGVVYTAVMAGGCTPTYIDTKRIPVGDYFAYAVAFDTDAQESVLSIDTHEVAVQKPRPKPAGNLRIE